MYKSKRIRKLVEKLKNFRNSHKEEISYVLNFLVYVMIYGFAVSYVMWGVFGMSIMLLAIPAWGIIVYFVKEEAIGELHKVISLIKTR